MMTDEKGLIWLDNDTYVSEADFKILFGDATSYEKLMEIESADNYGYNDLFAKWKQQGILN